MVRPSIPALSEVVDLTDEDSEDNLDSSNSETSTSTAPRNSHKRRLHQTDTNTASEHASTSAKRSRLSTTTGARSMQAATSTAEPQLHFRDRYIHCRNCGSLFDILEPPCHAHEQGPISTVSESGSSSEPVENDDKSDKDPKSDVCDCVYHSGEMEVDDDSYVWADHDERCHGTIDSDFCRKEYPAGFTWTCCDQTGDVEGCTMGRHEKGELGDYAELHK